MTKYKSIIVFLSIILAIIIYQKFISGSDYSSSDYKQFLNKYSEVKRIKNNGGTRLLLCYFSRQIDDSTIIRLADEYSRYDIDRKLSVLFFAGKVNDNGLSMELDNHSQKIVLENYDLLSNLFKLNREGSILYEMPNMKILSRFNYLVNPYTLIEGLNAQKIVF